LAWVKPDSCVSLQSMMFILPQSDLRIVLNVVCFTVANGFCTACRDI
jgi:hypothetical protein